MLGLVGVVDQYMLEWGILNFKVSKLVQSLLSLPLSSQGWADGEIGVPAVSRQKNTNKNSKKFLAKHVFLIQDGRGGGGMKTKVEQKKNHCDTVIQSLRELICVTFGSNDIMYTLFIITLVLGCLS